MIHIRNYLLLAIASFLCIHCASEESKDFAPFLAQGVMVGEVSDQSAIIQSRLTAVPTLSEGQVPGSTGFLRFTYGPTSMPDKNWIFNDWEQANKEEDFIVKTQLEELQPDHRYYYQAYFGLDTIEVKKSPIGSFRTNPGSNSNAPISFVVVTGMNYYHFHYGRYDSSLQYMGEDKSLGYPALASIASLEPDYFIGTGDNVYFDHPADRNYQNALNNETNPLPGLFGGKAVTDEAGMRRKYHVQFVQPRYKELFQKVGTYWLKDDHDYRHDDSDPYSDFSISPELGIKNFREQLPVVYPPQSDQPTYRTFRLSKDVQIWMPEGRDYRSANEMPDGPAKTIWGKEQKAWLKKTLLESTATYKFFVSATPMVGPDDARKSDNHVNQKGFRHEGDAFFDWLTENEFLDKNFYFICGDRHWQYHAIHPSGFEEFSCGALVDANSRAGRLAGDPLSTDPDAQIQQPYVQGNNEQATGGFLQLSVKRDGEGKVRAVFSFYDEKGALLYEEEKLASPFKR